jgi:hypothetical protein
VTTLAGLSPASPPVLDANSIGHVAAPPRSPSGATRGHAGRKPRCWHNPYALRTVFLSHSSVDNEAAARVLAALRGWGYESIFLDFDARLGIGAGVNWKHELYTQLRRCAAVVPLYSQSFFASRWCFAEVVAAGLLGKPVVAFRLDGVQIPSDLTHEQLIDFSADAAAGFERLRLALEREDISPARDFAADFSRSPYPGLNAFDEADAAVFFGRRDDVRAIVQRLAFLREFGGQRSFLLIAGPSGSGKSSVLRAGVLPALRKQPERWQVLSAIRPREGGGPIKELERQLARPCSNAEQLLEAQNGTATVIVGVDQFEELLADRAPADADVFARLLRDLKQPARVLVIATVRSDQLGAFQTHPVLRDLDFEIYPLPLLPQSAFAELVAGPAEVYGLQFEPPALVGKIAADAGTKEALPLLAFALREMYEKAGATRVLREANYAALGGIQGAVAQVAQRQFDSLKLSPAEHQAVRVAFHRLVRFDTNLLPAKIPAPWSKLPSASHRGISALIDARILVASTSADGERTVEVAHESLFRVWPTLTKWLEEDRRFLFWRQGLATEQERWVADPEDVLRGRALAEAREWQASRGEELDAKQVEFIDASFTATRRWNLIKYAVAAAFFVVVGIAGVASWIAYTNSQRLEAQIRLARGELNSPALGVEAPSVVEPSSTDPPSDPAAIPGRVRNQWRPGQVLHVRFLDGAPEIRRRISALAQQWMAHANITFVFDEAPDAALRVSVTGQGSWAYLGAEAMNIRSPEPTINLGDFSVPGISERERDRAVLHEFGHVLGLVHEFQMPNSSVAWNRQRVYDIYERQGWTKETVDRNFFDKYPADMFPQKPFDPQSIMMFPIPQEMTTDNVGYPQTYEISEGDKAFVRRLYPR